MSTPGLLDMIPALNLLPRENSVMPPSVIVENLVQNASKEFKEMSFASSPVFVSCCLSPIDDCFLVTNIIFLNSPEQLPNHNGGFVVSWNMEYDCLDMMDGCFYTYSLRPACQFSSDGALLPVVTNNGKQGVTVAGRSTSAGYYSLESAEIYSVGRPPSCLLGVVLHLSLSPCMDSILLLSTDALDTRLSLSLFVYKHNTMRFVRYQDISPISHVSITRVLNSKYSPDGSYFGLCTSDGRVLLFPADLVAPPVHIKPRTDSDAVADIGAPSSSCYFDFDPRFGSSRFVVAYTAGILQAYRKQSGQFMATKSAFDVNKCMNATSLTLINDICFARDGGFLAVAFSDGVIRVMSSEGDRVLSELMCNSAATTTCMSVCIASSCQELIGCYNDGMIRVWQLPRILNLQHICRIAVLSYFSMLQISQAELPQHLLEYLRYQHKYS